MTKEELLRWAEAQLKLRRRARDRPSEKVLLAVAALAAEE